MRFLLFLPLTSVDPGLIQGLEPCCCVEWFFKFHHSQSVGSNPSLAIVTTLVKPQLLCIRIGSAHKRIQNTYQGRVKFILPANLLRTKAYTSSMNWAIVYLSVFGSLQAPLSIYRFPLASEFVILVLMTSLVSLQEINTNNINKIRNHHFNTHLFLYHE